jgi:hypothetical protein
MGESPIVLVVILEVSPLLGVAGFAVIGFVAYLLRHGAPQ